MSRRRLRKFYSSSQLLKPLTVVILLVLLGLGILYKTQYKTSLKTDEENASALGLQTTNPALEEDILATVASELANITTFKHWAALENSADGYRFMYPEGFLVSYSVKGVEVTPPSRRGKVVISILNKTLEVSLEAEGVTGKEFAVLSDAKKLIQETFEFIPPYSTAEDSSLRKRFEK